MPNEHDHDRDRDRDRNRQEVHLVLHLDDRLQQSISDLVRLLKIRADGVTQQEIDVLAGKTKKSTDSLADKLPK